MQGTRVQILNHSSYCNQLQSNQPAFYIDVANPPFDSLPFQDGDYQAKTHQRNHYHLSYPNQLKSNQPAFFIVRSSSPTGWLQR